MGGALLAGLNHDTRRQTCQALRGNLAGLNNDICRQTGDALRDDLADR
jgi:hypothetical protein